MRIINLSQGKVAKVDDADYENLSRFKWYAQKGRNSFYAQRDVYSHGKRQTILMHRELLGLTGPAIDHKNGDGLDNRRENLRSASNVENAQNQRRAKNNSSGFKGVSFHKAKLKWNARICVRGKNLHLGYFDSPDDAHKAYCEAADSHFGDYARHE